MSFGAALTGIMQGFDPNHDFVANWKKQQIAKQVKEAMKPMGTAAGVTYSSTAGNGSDGYWVSDAAPMQQQMLDDQERAFVTDGGLRRYRAGNQKIGDAFFNTEAEANSYADKYNSMPSQMQRLAGVYGANGDAETALRYGLNAQKMTRDEAEYQRAQKKQNAIDAVNAKYAPMFQAGEGGMDKYAPQLVQEYNANQGAWADGMQLVPSTGPRGETVYSIMDSAGNVKGQHVATPQSYTQALQDAYMRELAFAQGDMTNYLNNERNYGLKRDEVTLKRDELKQHGPVYDSQVRLNNAHADLFKRTDPNLRGSGGGTTAADLQDRIWKAYTKEGLAKGLTQDQAEVYGYKRMRDDFSQRDAAPMSMADRLALSAAAEAASSKYSDAQIAQLGMTRKEWEQHWMRGQMDPSYTIPRAAPVSSVAGQMFGGKPGAATAPASANAPLTLSSQIHPDALTEIFRKYASSGLTTNNLEQWLKANRNLWVPIATKYIED